VNTDPSLLQVALEIGSDLDPHLDLDGTLQRFVRAAMVMTRARFGAIGVWDADGMLASFVHDGMDDDAVGKIGHLPAGKGLLGLLREHPQPVRIADLGEHPESAGFPRHHPDMRAFLGVPIVIRGEPYGGLYVADDRPGRAFTEDDEATGRALASVAAVAIDNARLIEQVREAARWTAASREITAALLSDSDPHVRPLHLIASRARHLAGAEQVIVLVPDDPVQPGASVDTLVVSAASGRYADDVLGQHIPVEGSTTGAVFRSGEPVITETFRRPIQSFTELGERSAIVVPLRSDDVTLGVIAVARDAGAPRFDESHLELVQDFANHAAIALTIARARRSSTELAMLADRERIASDLHDQVIQRVFAVGMDLQGVIARLRSPELAGRLTRSVDELQAVINDIRSTIFDLGHPLEAHGGFAKRIQDAVACLTEDREISATLIMSGPMSVVPETLADHAEAVVVEALSNAVRHSGAHAVTVEVAVGDDLRVEVTDDGHGIPADNQRHSGLANLARRAHSAGGDLAITAPPDGGTCVTWSAPLSDI
jgi:signal transduction histidine kinase